MRITDIHRQFGTSLNSISKHIKVLERTRLVRRRTEWREHMIEVDMAPLSAIDTWFTQLRSISDLRLDALDDILMCGENEYPHHA